MVALLAVVLFGAAALTVDIGRAVVERQAVQHRTDYAALTAGVGDALPATGVTATCAYGARAASSDAAVQEVAAYFNRVATPGFTSATALTDCDLSNGEALYGMLRHPGGVPTLVYDPEQLTVVSPAYRVDFGFAGVLGFDGTSVRGRATVQVRSPLISSMPLYVYSGCDWGRQTLVQPAGGHASGLLLASPHDTNDATLTSLTTSPATSPPQVPVNVAEPYDSLVVNGSGLAAVTHVGFFEAGVSGSGPPPVTVVVPEGAAAAGSLTVALPGAVTSVEDVWYVRVKIGGEWSAVTTGGGSHTSLAALPLIVGTAKMTCSQGPSDGNFGTLLLPNTSPGAPNGKSDNIAYNMATNIQHTLAVFPDAGGDWFCSSADPRTVLWPQEGTNCVDTTTGLEVNAAQKGLIDGVGGVPGRFTRVEEGSGCAEDGMPATKVFNSRTINNDTLSCFLSDDSTNLGMINGPMYGLDHPVLSARIYQSPRFALLPVVGIQPTSGGSKKYQIVEFRPAFITDQPSSATRTTPVTAGNGITATASKPGDIASLQVVFIHPDALPPPESGETTDYAGSGPRRLVLVD